MNTFKIILFLTVSIIASHVLLGSDAGVTFIGPSNYIPRLDLPQNIPLHSADSCKDCHREIYDQWRESLHSKSSTNPVFQACWTARNNPPFCSNCHFPMLEQKPKILRGFKETGPSPFVAIKNKEFDAILMKEGVTCVVCHLRNKTIYGPRKIKEGEAPHPVKYDPSFQKSEFCYTCHSWGFPRARIKKTCYTSDEYKRSGKKETCQDCHMERKEGLASLGKPRRIYGMHDQKSSRSPEELRKALKTELKTEKDTSKPGDKVKAEIRVTNTGAGHYVPTGCPVRAIAARVAVLDENGEEKGLKEYFITRTFEFPGYPTEVKDGRLAPGECKSFYYKYKIPRDASFKKLTLRLDMIEYLIFPKKADEAPIPFSKITVPFYSTSVEIMK